MATADSTSVEPESPTSPAPALANGPSVARAAPGASSDADDAVEAARRQRLQKLQYKIETQPDFATSKASMLSLQQTARNERAHTRALTDLIHDDPAMAGKLLRLINAAYYRAVGGGDITSVARAISLMGFRNVGMLAGSLALFEKLPAGSLGDRMRREFARAQYAAMLAHEFCNDRRVVDSIHLTATFHRLGDLMAGLHAPDDLQAIDDQLEERGLAPDTPEYAAAREALARDRWGIGLEQLGVEIAEGWGWPHSMVLGMRSLEIDNPQAQLEGDAYVRALCTCTHRLARTLSSLPNVGMPEERAQARANETMRFAAANANALGLNPEGLAEQIELIDASWRELIHALGVSMDENAPSPVTMAAEAKRHPPGSRAAKQELAEDLADAVQKLTQLNQKSAPSEELLNLSMDLLQKALHLQRVIVCLHDPETNTLVGRMGMGDRSSVLVPHFRIPVSPPSDLFGLLCVKNADTLISDTGTGVAAQRLPEWFGRKVKAGTFLLLPLMHEKKVLGMLYGDQREAGSIHVHDRALELLQRLRQQLILSMIRPPKP
jgi:HD-like signal output (HDOD) protein